MDGVLKSWAIPKGLPLKPGVRRLAVRVEDHQLSYIDFEGVIPPGQYGAGRVLIWDKGEYRLLERSESKIIVVFHGRKLGGKYIILETNLGGKERIWLIFKSKSS